MPENYFRGLIGIGIGVLLGFGAVKLISQKYLGFVHTSSKYPLRDIFVWLFKDSEMRKRIVITFGLLILVQAVSNIPLPGINISELKEFFDRVSGGMPHKFSIKAIDKMTILSLGLMPFFSACGLLQIASVFIPPLRRLSFGGENGRRILSKYAYILTIILSIIQSYFIALWLEQPAAFQGMQLVTDPGMGFRLLTVITLTTTVILLLYIAGLINRYGIGNGVAVIAVSYLFFTFFNAFDVLFELVNSAKVPPMWPLLLTAILITLAYVTFCLTRFSKTIGIQDRNGNKTHIPLRPTIVGSAPLSLAESVFLIPLTLASFVNQPSMQNFFESVYRNLFISSGVTAVLAFVMVYLYTLIVFDPKYIHKLMSQYGYSFVDGNQSNTNNLDDKMSKLLVYTGIVLVVVNILPKLAIPLLKIPHSVAILLGSTVLLIAVGVISDIVSQAVFFKEKAESEIKEWNICYVAFDEIEAMIKSDYLKNKGIPALVEPLRFSWGMPIRTIVDQYRIYVPSDNREEARNLIIAV